MPSLTPLETYLAQSVADLLPLARRLLWLQRGLEAHRDERIVWGMQLLEQCEMAEDRPQPEIEVSDR